MIEKIVDTSECPCEAYHEVNDIFTYASTAKKQIEHHHVEGVGFSTILDSIAGFASTSDMKNLERVYELSKTFAQYGSHSRYLPHPRPPAGVNSCFDSRIAEAQQEDVLDLFEGVLGDIPSSCTVIDGMIKLKTQKVRILNSNGLDVTRESTFAVLDVLLQENRRGLTLYSCFNSRSWDMCWPLSEEVDQWMKNIQKKSDIDSGETEVILSPTALSRILDAVFVPAICGDLPEVCEMLFNQPDKGLAPEINIHDHGTLEGGIGTEPFDGEGVPQQRTPIVEKGQVTSVLCDTTRALVHEKSSTGNAVRQSFEDVPHIYVTNLLIQPACTKEELFDEVRDGIWVGDLFGAQIVNPPTGDFVSNISTSYRIRKGEPVGILPPKTIEGTIFSLLKDFMPGDDMKKVDRYVVPSSKARMRVY